jgi:hypothetical protein
MINNKLLSACIILPGILCSLALVAQVPVREEPHHKVVLENQYVRLIDVHIAPNDTTSIHTHEVSSVIVFLTTSTIGTQIIGEKPVINDVKPGQTNYGAYGDKKVTHRVWNQGGSLFHVMDIELVKQQTGHDTCLTINQSGIKLQWQQPLVRTYNMEINQGISFAIPKSACAHLLIDISGVITTAAGATVRTIQDGGFVFFPPNSNIQISSNKNIANCVLLELK